MSVSELQEHLFGGVTTVARVWWMTRRDGVSYGFTDHDKSLTFDGKIFRANTGISATMLSQNSGLSVDNCEAMGVLSDDTLTEADILNGQFDGASVVSWLVNWRDVAQRRVEFRGFIGEISRSDGAFRAEMRGLSDLLNQTQGRRYQKSCSALLGDATCGVDLSMTENSVETPLISIEGGYRVTVDALPEFETAWFTRGTLSVTSGRAAGQVRSVKFDQNHLGQRVLTLWEPIHDDLAIGDVLRLAAGCDKFWTTCRDKFANLERFRGFPDLPSDSWLAAYPNGDAPRDGGSRR